MTTPLRCPLCTHADTVGFARAHGRRYLRCPECLLTFLHAEDRLDAEAERAHYETHENDPSDPGYRAFLRRVADPLMERLLPGAEGLDYGSGPGPTLSLILAERGFETANYDPFFAPDPAPLQRTWDFVTCTETAEHFFEPGREFRALADLLRRPGWLAIMTRVLDDDEGFEAWWYVRDPTHVSFYRAETLEWIARAHGWALERPRADVALFLDG
ncbi:MAG: class I SAM-dependent methyltransferase [Gemmatimonadetes bacterium]|nr:class I SAM-dependent methyltransferase [Gemmatimonadota bacterium]